MGAIAAMGTPRENVGETDEKELDLLDEEFHGSEVFWGDRNRHSTAELHRRLPHRQLEHLGALFQVLFLCRSFLLLFSLIRFCSRARDLSWKIVFLFLLQAPCFFHARYRSGQSCSYRKNGRRHSSVESMSICLLSPPHLLHLIHDQYHHNSSSSSSTGRACQLSYGTGNVTGFLSQDNIHVGNLVIKNQV